MSNNNQSLASLFQKMLQGIPSGNYSKKQLEADKAAFKKKLNEVRSFRNSNKDYLPNDIDGIKETGERLSKSSFERKVEMQRLSRSNKNSKTESSFVKKASKSILDGIKGKKKAKGDAIAEKVRKQREARNPKPEKKVIKDPKKVKSLPFYLG